MKEENTDFGMERKMSEKIKVVVAEDMEPIRRLYCRMIDESEDMEIVGSAGSGAEAVDIIRQRHPDVVLLDIEMETRDAGLRAAEVILEEEKDPPKIIILTVYEEDEMILTAFRLGVSNYLMKNAPKEEVLQGIRDAYCGMPKLSSAISQTIVGDYKKTRNYETSLLFAVQMITELSVSEIELLKLFYEGKTRREICRLRHVEMSTVKSQVHSILKKFEKNSIEEVVDSIRRENIAQVIFGRKSR